jgi:hypothetical protein
MEEYLTGPTIFSFTKRDPELFSIFFLTVTTVGLRQPKHFIDQTTIQRIAITKRTEKEREESSSRWLKPNTPIIKSIKRSRSGTSVGPKPNIFKAASDSRSTF